MIRKISTKNMPREEWLAVRKSLGLGGSDISSILGMNEYKSAVELFYEKLDLRFAPDISNEKIESGHFMEDVIAKIYEHYHPDTARRVENMKLKIQTRKVIKRNAIITNSKYPRLFANIDREIIKHPDHKDRGILEIKNMGEKVFMKYDPAPPYYITQLQQYMMVYEKKWAEFGFFIDGCKLEVIPQEPHPGIQAAIIDQGNDFMDRVIAGREIVARMASESNPDGDLTEEEAYQMLSEIEPDVDDTPAYYAFISEKWKKMMNRVKIDADENLEKLALDYLDAHENLQVAEKQKQAIKNQIMKIMIDRGAELADGNAVTISIGKQFSVRKNRV